MRSVRSNFLVLSLTIAGFMTPLGAQDISDQARNNKIFTEIHAFELVIVEAITQRDAASLEKAAIYLRGYMEGHASAGSRQVFDATRECIVSSLMLRTAATYAAMLILADDDGFRIGDVLNTVIPRKDLIDHTNEHATIFRQNMNACAVKAAVKDYVPELPPSPATTLNSKR
jgi:hypothetical protein